MKGFYDVEVGDVIMVYDSSSHDYEEHMFRVTSIENDEDGTVLFGKDLTYSNSEGFDNYLERVTQVDFVGFVKDYAEKIIENIKFSYYRSTNQTANMFSACHTKFNCKITYEGKSFQSTYQCNVETSDMDNIKVDFLYSVMLDKSSYDVSKDIEDFASNLGMNYYDDKTEVNRCWRACERTSIRLYEMFSGDELNILAEYFRVYF